VDLDKLFEKIPYDRLYPIKPLHRMAALAGVSILVAALLFFTVIQGQHDTMARLETDLTAVKRKIDENKLHIQKRGKLIAMIAELEGQLDEAKRQLPTDQEIPELLEQISNLGTQFGLEFLTFRPNPEVRRDFYADVPVSLKMSGGYHDALKFFDEVAHLPRIVTINNMTMKTSAPVRGRGAKTSSVRAGDLEVECLAVTYRYIEGSTAPAAGGDAKGKK
jgi:type IV pilus assembly protein PilO